MAPGGIGLPLIGGPGSHPAAIMAQQTMQQVQYMANQQVNYTYQNH